MQDNIALLKLKRLPTTWCPGCGNGLVLKAMSQALHEKGLYKDIVAVSGIGCVGRLSGYLNIDSVHTLHGRALPVAEGIKAANPRLTVVVISGDGDLLAIGGNHLLHASRRNSDIKVICVNNRIYGMTGGQASPATPEGAITSSTPAGNPSPEIRIQPLLLAHGNMYSRTTVYHLKHMKGVFLSALERPGFSFTEVMSNCYQGFGKNAGFSHPYDMLLEFKTRFRPVEGKDFLGDDEIGVVGKGR